MGTSISLPKNHQNRLRNEGEEAFFVNCGQTTDRQTTDNRLQTDAGRLGVA